MSVIEQGKSDNSERKMCKSHDLRNKQARSMSDFSIKPRKTLFGIIIIFFKSYITFLCQILVNIRLYFYNEDSIKYRTIAILQTKILHILLIY